MLLEPATPTLLAYEKLAAAGVTGAPVLSSDGQIIANLSASDIRMVGFVAADSVRECLPSFVLHVLMGDNSQIMQMACMFHTAQTISLYLTLPCCVYARLPTCRGIQTDHFGECAKRSLLYSHPGIVQHLVLLEIAANSWACS